MQHYSTHDFARSLADRMIRERFGRVYGIETLDSYFDLIDARQTQHLADGHASRVIGTTGAQRRKVELTLEDAVTVIVNVPMNDPRRPGAVIWAQTELGIWLDLIEMGADGSWFFVYKGKDRSDGQVVTKMPIWRTAATAKTPIARLIANAKPGQQARTRDHNGLNLRRANVFLVGNSQTAEGRIGGARNDSRAVIGAQAAIRQSLAGQDSSFINGEDQ